MKDLVIEHDFPKWTFFLKRRWWIQQLHISQQWRARPPGNSP